MKKKGFTLVELLVVIAIIALLMSILMPALARVRELANRVVCGTNCRGTVNAMLVYANDTEAQKFPRAAGPTSVWGATAAFDALTMNAAFDILIPTRPGAASITASLYLLVRHDYTSPKQFICKSDPIATQAFEHPDQGGVWDVALPREQCSYSYHVPYSYTSGGVTLAYPITPASDPTMVVVADRNPFVAPSDMDYLETGNSEAHQLDGQNAAYVDAHVTFEKNPAVGLDGDNIYTIAAPRPPTGPPPPVDVMLGTVPAIGGTAVSGPVDRRDSVVVSQP